MALSFALAIAICSVSDAQVFTRSQVVPYNFQIQAVYPRHYYHHYHPVYPRYVYPRYGYGYYYQTQPYFGVYPRVYGRNVQMGIYFNNGYLLHR